MPRGIMPRRPSRSGRQDKVTGAASRGKAPITKKSVAGTRPSKSSLSGARAKRKVAKTSAPPKPKVAKPTSKAALKGAASPKGYKPVAPGRVNEILARLDDRYASATCALEHRSAWELLVATILSAQCTDVRVNMVTPVLFEKYPTPEALASLEPADIEDDIRSTGFFRNKSKSLVGAARKVVGEFGGQVPRTMDEMLQIPGVARKTANVVLGTWYKIADGVVVDTHVHRLSRRLELTKNDDPRKIEQDLMKVIPHERWIVFSHQLIMHGRMVCFARSPKCVDCPLENLCHAADKTWSTVDIHKSAKA